MKHVPNALTITRIVLTPVMLVFLLSGTLLGMIGALFLFVVAAISDYLDGRIARSYKVRSRLGQFLDPLADKILILGTFITLIFIVPDIVTWWAVALIALRDVSVTGLRSWVESRGRSLRTLPIAKAKTGVQIGFIIALLVLLVAERLPEPVAGVAVWILDSPIPFLLLLGVVLFTLVTGALYLIKQEETTSANQNV